MEEKIISVNNFEQIIKKYEKMVYSVAYKFLNNHQDAEDITQETFLIVFRKIKSLRKTESLNSWIYTITLNLTREYLKQKYRKNKLMEACINTQVQERKENIKDGYIEDKLKFAIEKLSPQQKKCIELKYLKELKIKEISQILKCKEGTVKAHIFRGIRLLKEILQNGNL